MLRPLVVAALTLASAACGHTPDLDRHATLDHIRDSAVRVWAHCPGRKPSSGSGVVVSRAGHILTAAHVLRGCPKGAKAHVGLAHSDYVPPKKTHSAVLVATEARVDLALLKTEQPLAARAVAAVDRRFTPRVGLAIRIAGFSTLPFRPRDTEATRPRSAPSLQMYPGAIQSGRMVGDRLKWLHYTGRTLKGSSGGGVWTLQGQLVAIHKERYVGNVTNVFIEEDHTKWGNTFQFKDGDGKLRRITASYKGIRSALEYTGRGIGLQNIPDAWIRLIRAGGAAATTR